MLLASNYDDVASCNSDYELLLNLTPSTCYCSLVHVHGLINSTSNINLVLVGLKCQLKNVNLHTANSELYNG